jgi:hypothetical protein
LREDFAAAFGHAIGHNNVGIACSADEARGIERFLALMQDHLGERL